MGRKIKTLTKKSLKETMKHGGCGEIHVHKINGIRYRR